MKKLFKRKKKSLGDVGSLASGRSASGYNVSPKKDLHKIHKAAFDNDIAKLKSLLKREDINQLDKENRTALHLACAQGNLEAVQSLVSHPQCNLNLCDNDRRSALMKCVQCQFQNCLEVLINKRADVNLSDVNGNTALHLAAAIPSIDACCLLLDSNADTSHKNKEGSTALHIASSTEGAENVISDLIEDGALVNAVDNSGKTPLMLAASRGFLDSVRILLNQKADASVKDSRGWSADDYASMNGHHPISMIIFEHSQTQKKPKSYQPSMGDHIYATVNKKKPSAQPAAFSARYDDDLSLSDDSNNSLPSSKSENSVAQKQKTPTVNVAAFMKQFQMKKNNLSGGNEDEAGDSADVNHNKKQIDFRDAVENKTSATDLRSYENNLSKVGPISPNKPPLPGNHSSGDLSNLKNSEPDEDEDSPWDEEEDDLPPAMPASTTHYAKPDQAITSSLGLTNEDINDIYKDRSDESLSPDDDVAKQNGDGKKELVSKAGLSGSDEELSSAWDDEELSGKPPVEGHSNFLASSSLLKFDDEVSDLSSSYKSKPHDQEVILESHPEDDSSNPAKVNVRLSDVTPASLLPPQKTDRPGHVITAPGSAACSELTDDDFDDDDDDDDDIDVDDDNDSLESESEWERENRLRREQLKKEQTNDISGGTNDGDQFVPLETKKSTQKTLAMEAAAAAKMRAESRRKKEEEKKRQEEEQQHRELLAGQDRQKIEAALQAILVGSTEPTGSDISNIDEDSMGNSHSSARKVADGGALSAPMPKKRHKLENGNVQRREGVTIPEISTDTETESDVEEDFVGAIPASLHSSQLSEELIRSAKRGDLEREAAREKRRAINAIEQAEFARRDVAILKEQLEEYKTAEEQWEQDRSDMEATIRKLKFEHSRLNEQAESTQLELKRIKERNRRIEENFEIESDTRRKCESTIFELQSEMKILDQQLKKLENDNRRLLNELQRTSGKESLSLDPKKMDQGLKEDSTHSRQIEALNLLLQEKDQDLIRIKAERDSLEEAKERYKDEARKWSSDGNDKVHVAMELNDQLNTKVEELNFSLKERDEKLKQARMQFDMEASLLKRANEAVTDQIKRERMEKENALHDLEALNKQQGMLKKKIEDTEEMLRKEENKFASLLGEMKAIREQKENLERRLHGYEVNENTSLQEAGNLRTVLTHKETALTQALREGQEVRERLKGTESELNESRRENAKLLGRVEMLQVDVSQQESERIRLRRELDEARNQSDAALTSQQGKLSEIMTANQTERVELEKMNARLKQQVSCLKEEAERIGDEKMKKEEELARAQQDRIEAHKHLSFTESSMAQLTESQHQLQQDKQDLSAELQASKARCSSLENRVDEAQRQVATLRDQLSDEQRAADVARREVQDLEGIRIEDKEKIRQLEKKVEEVELDMGRLRNELGTSAHREKDARDDREVMLKSRQQLEELVAKLQDEKVEAEERMKEEVERCQILENEASGHKRMWEEEVRSRSKLSVELAKADQDKKDARNLLNSYKEKYRKASMQMRSYRSKYENGHQRWSKMEQQLDDYSRMAAESRALYDSSESESGSRLSRMSEEHEREKSQLEVTVRRLQARLLALDHKMSKEKELRGAAEREAHAQKSAARRTEESVAELERERDQLRDEVKRLKSYPSNQSRVSMEANAQVNAKLDQVNAWLEEHSVAQEALEKLRFDNEEKRVAEEARRADALQRELDLMRSSYSDDHEERMRRELQEVTREKIDLHEKLLKLKQDMEEMKIKLDHEKKKSAQIRASAISGAIAGHIGSFSHPSNSSNNQSSVDILSSTPRREVTDPMLAQLRHKLDASIAMRLSSPPPPNPDAIGANRPRPVSNDYFIP